MVPGARVWTYGYNAAVVGGLFRANNKNSILQHGNDFMVKVERSLSSQIRTSEKTCLPLTGSTSRCTPVILVAHSLGGLIVKDVCLFVLP